MRSQASESLLGASACRRPISGRRPIADIASVASTSRSEYNILSRAFGGLQANRGLWVIGDIREPNLFQCSATRRSSLRGHLIGKSLQELQYSFAVLASTHLTFSILSVLGSSSLNRAIKSAVAESWSMSRTSAA